MFKKSTTNKQLGLLTTASSLMCKRESKQYEDEKEWHMQFYRNIGAHIRCFDTPKRNILHHPQLTCRLGITSR